MGAVYDELYVQAVVFEQDRARDFRVAAIFRQACAGSGAQFGPALFAALNTKGGVLYSPACR